MTTETPEAAEAATEATEPRFFLAFQEKAPAWVVVDSERDYVYGFTGRRDDERMQRLTAELVADANRDPGRVNRYIGYPREFSEFGFGPIVKVEAGE